MPEVVELKKQVEDMKKNKYSGDVENASTVDVKQVENISNKQRHTKYSQNTNSGRNWKKLQDKLISLRAEYTNKINDVIASAIVEYKAAEGGENKQEIFNKYIELVRELELECDARVYATIAKAENKLMKYNYNTDIADIAREEYKRQKEEKRNQLLESFLNNLTN